MPEHPVPAPSSQDDLVAIGRIVKTFGVRGEVKVLSLTDVPGRFESLTRVLLEAPSGRTLPAAVTSRRVDRDGFVLGFDALSSPEAAAAFRGGFVKIPRPQPPSLPEGQFFEYDLVGMTVGDEGGTVLGTIEDIMSTPANHVFVVRKDGREWLIPATRSAVASVDVAGRTMTVRRGEGWVDEEA